MRRRSFLWLLGFWVAASKPAWVCAQQSAHTYRVAVLTSIVPAPGESFLSELRRGGLIEGRNLIFDRRGVGVEIAGFEAAAAELVNAAPDAILTWGPAAGHAAQLATRLIPIVALTDDPIESRLVASMSRPGGNVTGVGIFAAQLDAKRLEILHEVVPTAKRIGILIDPTQAGQEQVERIARDLNLELVTREARRIDDVVEAIDALAATKVDAMNVLASALFYSRRELIIDRVRRRRLPTIYWWPDLVRDGGLVGFGPSVEECDRLPAQQLLRVLRGTAPAELPIIQPTRFELVINLTSAKALDLGIPQSILTRADEVLE
jgi:putative tryptophan/tyrosine transport system substrate-binding protein